MTEKRIDLTELYKKQISLTELFANIKHSKTEELRAEDNDKRDRLGVLHEIIGLPFDKPTQFNAVDIVNNSDSFRSFMSEHGNETCALRLITFDASLPKLRMRGAKIKDVVDGWFKEQKIDSKKYKADFVPHPTMPTFGSIFVVNNKGIFGEIIHGGHNQLTQGFHDNGKPVSFSYDFKEWKFSSDDLLIKEHAIKIINAVKVTDSNLQSKVIEQLNSSFTNNYLEGYFESVESQDFGLWFIDYNQTLAKMYSELMPVIMNKSAFLSGQPASMGKVSGKVKIVRSEDLDGATIDNEILVCNVTT